MVVPTTKLAMARRELVSLLSENQDGFTLAELTRRIRVSQSTVVRAYRSLRGEGAPIDYDGATRRYLLRSAYASPLEDPKPEDLTALMLGRALIEPFVDEEAKRRLDRLIDQLDARIRKRTPLPRAGSISTISVATTVEPRILRDMLRAIPAGVVRIEYLSPWSGERTVHVVEPWGIRLVDGAIYVQAYSRATSAPRTFNLAAVQASRVLDEPRRATPPTGDVWSEGDPAYGIDNHCPGTATIRMRGPVARWAAAFRWHSGERVKDLGGGRFERSLPYRSRREFARKLLSVIDAVEHIEPPDLADEVDGYLAAYQRRRLDRSPRSAKK